MCPVVSVICGVAARACVTMCLRVSSRRHNFSCLLCWSLGITTLDGSLLWSLYLQFACSVELVDHCFSHLFLPIQHPALPTPHRKWFMVGIVSGKFLHWSSFSVTMLVPAHRVAIEPHCCAWYLYRAPTNLWWHQFPSSSIGNVCKYTYMICSCTVQLSANRCRSHMFDYPPAVCMGRNVAKYVLNVWISSLRWCFNRLLFCIGVFISVCSLSVHCTESRVSST